MKNGDIVDIYYHSGSTCPICGETNIDWTDGSWMCGFRSQFRYGVPEGKVCVDQPCKNFKVFDEVTLIEECDCSGHQLLHFGHKCNLLRKKK